MKNIVYAFIISILIHFLFFYTYESNRDLTQPKKNDKTKNIQTVRFVKLKPKEVIKKDIPKEIPSNINKEKVDTKKFKKVIKENFKQPIKRDIIKKQIKVNSKPSTKTEVKPTYTKSLPIKPKKVLIPKKENKPKLEDKLSKQFDKKQKSLDEESKKIQKNTLDSFLATPNIGEEMVDSITQGYLDLYGDEFKDFTKVQKVFLRKKLKDIGRITQRYMVYPRISIRLKQQGTNVVEFMLYPNGDIGNILLSTSSGYEALDKSSVHTIEIAFKDYPRPKEATKVKIYMTYVLY